MCIWVLSGCGRSTDLTSIAGDALDDAAGSPADLALHATHSDLQSADSLRHGTCAAFGLPLRIPTGCDYDAGARAFVCGPDLEMDGWTRTRSYRFLDEAGVPQASYDSLATATITFASTVGGTIIRHGRTTTLADRRDLVESGLLSAEATRIWNGTGTSSRRDSVGSDVTTVESTTQVSGVVVPAPWARDSWPLSGTITTRRVSSRGGDVTVVISFDGTRYATMMIGDRTMTIDLARGRFGDGRGPGGPRGPGRGHGGRP